MKPRLNLFLFFPVVPYRVTINAVAQLEQNHKLYMHSQTELRAKSCPVEHFPRVDSSFRSLFRSRSPRTEQRCAATTTQPPMHKTWDFNPLYATLHYSAHYMQRAIPIAERTPCRKFLHRSLNFQVYALRVTAAFLLRDNVAVLSLAINESDARDFLVEAARETSKRRSDNSDSVAIGIRWHVSKGKRKGCCTYSWLVSVPCLWTSWCQSLGVGLFGFFLGSFFLLFVFSQSLFSGFLNPNALSLQHCQSGHLRTCAQIRNLPAASARKSLGRFITLILTWCGHDGVNRGHLRSCQLFARPLREQSGARCKKRHCGWFGCVLVRLTREITLSLEMPPVDWCQALSSDKDENETAW